VTVAFERTTEEDARNLVQSFLRAIEQPVDAAIASSGGSVDRQAIAEKLLQPDFLRYPELAEHCRSVSVLAQRFARLLELPASQVETVRIAALVHDAGLRLIEYDRLYRASTLTPEEKRVMAEHPIVGAALVEPLLGTDVAQAVLRHHERVDGGGYPSRLRGQQIPLASRIIQIADAWIAMTAEQSYKPPVPAEIAADRLREGAGTQFDAKLVEAFLKALPELAG
jgi:HD-GYP domain-containing protein (c-di-GMP phosphodiesterase class II)